MHRSSGYIPAIGCNITFVLRILIPLNSNGINTIQFGIDPGRLGDGGETLSCSFPRCDWYRPGLLDRGRCRFPVPMVWGTAPGGGGGGGDWWWADYWRTDTTVHGSQWNAAGGGGLSHRVCEFTPHRDTGGTGLENLFWSGGPMNGRTLLGFL